MDNNRDWKPIIALALAGLALFIALGVGRGNEYPAAAPQQIIVQPAAPTGGAQAPVVAVPGAYTGVAQPWGGPGWGHRHHFNPFFPLLFFGGLIFLAFWLFGRNRHRWGGPGGYGRPWGGPGPGPGPQGPPQGQAYGQYPPQNAQGQGQQPPYGGYPQAQQPQQGQPTQSMGANGDITRPEGSGDN